jgi:signal transduction histidine kinase
LLDNPRNNVDIYHEVLQDIDSEVDRLTRLTDDLLSLNREEVNYTSLNRSWVDLEALFKEIMHKLTPLANEQGSQLIMEVSPGLKGLLDQEKI